MVWHTKSLARKYVFIKDQFSRKRALFIRLPNHDHCIHSKRVEGRLKVCTSSLMFEPEEDRLPIIKLHYARSEINSLRASDPLSFTCSHCPPSLLTHARTSSAFLNRQADCDACRKYFQKFPVTWRRKVSL